MIKNVNMIKNARFIEYRVSDTETGEIKFVCIIWDEVPSADLSLQKLSTGSQTSRSIAT